MTDNILFLNNRINTNKYETFFILKVRAHKSFQQQRKPYDLGIDILLLSNCNCVSTCKYVLCKYVTRKYLYVLSLNAITFFSWKVLSVLDQLSK